MRALIALLLSLWLAPAWAQVPMTGAGKGTPGAATAMVTPIFSVTSALAPSNSATNYTQLPGTTSGWNATLGNRHGPIATAGTISNLTVRFPTATGAGATYDICLVQNSAGGSSTTCSALACQITNAATTCADNSNSVSVSAGDLLAWKVVPTNTPASQTAVQIAAKFTSSAAGQGVVFTTVSSNFSSASVANYVALGQGNVVAGATEATAASIVPTAGVLSKLYVNTSSAPGAGKSIVLTVYKNGSATGITCTLTGAGSGSGITFCNDTTHTATFAAGDTVSLEENPSGTPIVGNITSSMLWTPTTPGEAIVSGVVGALSNSATVYSSIYDSTNSGTEANQLAISPSAFTVKSLYSAINAAPGGTATRQINFRKGTGGGQANAGTPGNLSCTITSAVTTCNDTTDSFTTAANDLINWQFVPANTPASITNFKFSAVLYTP